jgi:plastocyanin
MPIGNDGVMSHTDDVTFVQIDGLAHNADSTSVMPPGIRDKGHCFIGVTFEASGSVVTPTAGTYDITVETWNNPGVFQSITDGSSIDATAAVTTLSVAGNITAVKFEPTSISGNSVDEVVLRVSAMNG